MRKEHHESERREQHHRSVGVGGLYRLHRDTTARTRPGLDHDRFRIILHLAGNEPCQGVLQPGREARQYMRGSCERLCERPRRETRSGERDTGRRHVNTSRRVIIICLPDRAQTK